MKKIFKYIAVLLIIFQSWNVSAADAANTSDAKGFSVFGQLLYWNVSEQTDSVWANDIGFPATNHVTYSTPNVRFNYSAGFRGGIAYAFPQFWNVKLYWTHLPTSKTVNYVAGENHVLTPEFFSGFLSSDNFSSARMNWQIAMNTIDLAISHAFNVTQSLTISPSVGLKEATINQTINTDLNASLFSIPIFTATEVVKNNFSGIGPSLGVNGQWNFYKDFSVVGDFSTAFMWGRWKIDDTYTRPSALYGLIQPATINTNTNDSKLGTAVFQYFLGLQWVYQASYQVKFLLGYEMQYWPSQLRAPTFQLLPLHGDMTLQGATCGISISL